MISLKTRLKCIHSYATEDNPHLLCDIAKVCDGTLYDCCLWNMSMTEQMEIIAENERTVK